MPGYLYGAFLVILQILAVIVLLNLFFSKLKKDEETTFKTQLRSIFQQFKSAGKGIIIILSILLVMLFALDGFVMMKFFEQKDADQVMDFLLLDKMHRNADDLLNDLSKEIKNFSANHPEFNVKYKVEKQSNTSYEDMVVDQAFQVVLYAEHKDLSKDPELKKINFMLDDLETLRKEMARIESSLSNPIKVQKGDTHQKICLSYLKDEIKLEDKEIKSILKRTALFSSLIPKFYVYNLYKDGVFLTTVTQGEASLSPMTVSMLSQRKMMSKVLKENNELKVSLDSLRSTFTIRSDSTGI